MSVERLAEPALHDAAVIAPGSAILDARITHVRHGEKRYSLSHAQWYLNIDLDDLGRLDSRLIGYNRRALVSLRDRDYGEGREPLRTWIARAFADGGHTLPAGRITLLTMPRVVGLVFNPVSFWLCRDPEGNIRGVLAEVNNTFGERHCYVCVAAGGGVIDGRADIKARKVFYVSPFMTVDGIYRFRFVERAGRLAVFITLERDGRRVLFASIAGDLSPLTRRALATRLVRRPLPAASVLLLIHIHAARLYRRGLKLIPRPPRPATLVSPPEE